MMRKRSIDGGYFVVLALTLLVIWPLLRTASLPHDTDAELHIFRLAELARMWDGGIVYPRWAANFYYGYGYPIFNYYAPLTYYVGLLFMLLPGVGAVLASKLVLIFGLVGGAIGMYGFVRGRFGRSAGIVAAASYSYAPYLVYIDPHGRGVLPESFSFCIFPLALWSLDSLLRRPSARRLITTCLLIAAVMLTHNLMAMIFGAFLFVYFIWEQGGRLLSGNGVTMAEAIKPFWVGLIVFPIGVAIAAFFWIPMVFEQDVIQIGTVIGEGSHYDYRNHFLSLGEMLAVVQRFDWGASEPFYTYSLGIVQWLLGLAGFGRILLTKFTNRRLAILFALASVILIFLMLPISQPIWQAIPLLPFLQFPWRLLGAGNAMLAVTGATLFASAPEAENETPLFSNRIVLAALLLIIVFALPLLQVKPWPTFGGTSASDVLSSELAGRWRGTTSTADFVPATVEVSPQAQPAIIEQIAANQPIDPVNRGALGNAKVETEIITPVHFRFDVSSDDPFVLRFFIFDFPGWQATVDGVSAEIELGTPDGFITLPLEEGKHEVELLFGTTPERRISWWTSAAALLAMGFVAFAMGRQVAPVTVEGGWHDRLKPRGLIGAIAAFSLLSIAVIEPAGWLHFDSQGSSVPMASVDEPDILFEDKIELIGYDVPLEVEPGHRYEIVVFWKAARAIEKNYHVFVHLISAEKGLISQSDKLNPGDFPTRQWTTAEYVRDPHQLKIPDSLPPGSYTIQVGLWSSETNQRLQTVTTPQSDAYVLKQFTVEK